MGYYNWSDDNSASLNMGLKFYDHLALVMQEVSKSAIQQNIPHWYQSLRELYRLISPWIKDEAPTKEALKPKHNRTKAESLFKLAYSFINSNNSSSILAGNNGGSASFAASSRVSNLQRASHVLDTLQMLLYDVMKEKNLILPTRDDEGDDDWDMD